MKVKKLKLIKWLTAFFTLGICFLPINPVNASVNQDSPPQHISLDNIFQVPSGSNSVIINDSTGDIVQITDNVNNQNGGIWSTGNNKMDLTQDFTASMYVYFGDLGSNAADGIAFVMHNDPDGPNALRANAEGGRVGVWDSERPDIYGEAIHNSFAIEFDTHFNNNFDDPAGSSNHIAYNFPDKPSSYEDSGISWLGTRKRKLIHRQTQYPGNLANDSWHHFTIKWTAQTGDLVYQFDSLPPVSLTIDTMDVFNTNQVYWGFTGSTGAQVEMNRVVFESVPGLVEADAEEIITNQSGDDVSGKSVNAGEQLTYTIIGNYISGKQDWFDIVVETTINDHVVYVPNTLSLILEDGTIQKLSDTHWNGNNLEVPIGDLGAGNDIIGVMFDVLTLPVSSDTLVSESANLKGKNYLTQSNDVTYTIRANQPPVVNLDNAGTSQVVRAGDDYTLTGTWLDPDGTYIKLSILVDGTSVEEVEKTSSAINQSMPFDYKILNNLLAPGSHKIEIYGTDVNGTMSNVESLNLQVLSPPVLTLDSANETQGINLGDGYKIQGSVQDLDSDQLELFYTIDNGNPVSFASLKNDNKGTPVVYEYEIPASDLIVGTHLITVYAVDSDGLNSDSESLTLQVTGFLSFTKISSAVNFETTTIPKTSEEVKRDPNWDIRVQDTRGMGGSWKVYVTLVDELKNQEGKKLTHSLYYEHNGQKDYFELGIPIEVYSVQVSDDNEKSIDWNEDEGMLLNIDSSAYAGQYQGGISWDLVDGP